MKIILALIFTSIVTTVQAETICRGENYSVTFGSHPEQVFIVDMGSPGDSHTVYPEKVVSGHDENGDYVSYQEMDPQFPEVFLFRFNRYANNEASLLLPNQTLVEKLICRYGAF